MLKPPDNVVVYVKCNSSGKNLLYITPFCVNRPFMQNQFVMRESFNKYCTQLRYTAETKLLKILANNLVTVVAWLSFPC